MDVRDVNCTLINSIDYNGMQDHIKFVMQIICSFIEIYFLNKTKTQNLIINKGSWTLLTITNKLLEFHEMN